MRRRDWLRAALGLFAAACTGRVGSRRIAGSFVGSGAGRGHGVVRDGLRLVPGASERTEVAIVGGGIAGLGAAWRLARSGLDDFVVLELEDRPGGTSAWGDGPVVPHPWGAHYVPVPDPENRPLVALLEEVGAVAGRDAEGRPLWAEDALIREPEERLFFRGEWHEGLYPRAGASRADLAELERFDLLMREQAAGRDAAGRRRFAAPRALGSDAPEVRALDRLSMAGWLEAHGFRSPRLRWLVDHSCRDDFGGRAEQVSAWAGLHYFAARLDPETGQGAPFLAWPEGNGRLARHLAGVAGARLRSGAVAGAVREGSDRVAVDWLDAGSGVARRLLARRAIVAVPRHVRRALLAGHPAAGDSLRYVPWVVANLWLAGWPASRGFPPAWDNVIHASESLGYVAATHQAGRDRGATVWTWYLPLAAEDPVAARRRLLASRWEDWVERILADLAPAHPDLARRVERIDVRLWGHGMVRPEPGACWSEAVERAGRPAGRLHFAHTDLSAMALVEEAFHHGVRAADEVLQAPA